MLGEREFRGPSTEQKHRDSLRNRMGQFCEAYKGENNTEDANVPYKFSLKHRESYWTPGVHLHKLFSFFFGFFFFFLQINGSTRVKSLRTRLAALPDLTCLFHLLNFSEKIFSYHSLLLSTLL